MKPLDCVALCCVIVGFLLIMVGSAWAITNSYVEDFSTKQYRDPVYTTALWDTIAGELRLPPFQVSIVGSCATPGSARGIAVGGDYAYIADYDYGLYIVEISDPAGPVLGARCDTPGLAEGVAIGGSYAFVADRGSGLQVISISNLASPTLVGTYDTPGEARGVAASGGHVFVADGYSGLQVISIANPAAPALVGSCDTPGYARGVAVAGDYAFVADSNTGLQVISIANLASPTVVGSYDTPGSAYGVAIAGDWAYVADYSSGLLVLDITDPTGPTLAGSRDTPGYAVGLSVDGDRAYIADANSGLEIVDVTNPTSPVVEANVDTPGSAGGVAVFGEYVFIADYTSGLRVVQSRVSQIPTHHGGWTPLVYGSAVAVDGDHAYIADVSLGLKVISISNPASPTLVGTCPCIALDVAISGDYAYIAAGESLLVVSIANPAYPAVAASCATGDCEMVVVSADYAYAVGDTYLRVVDISDPVSPSVVGSFDGHGSGYVVHNYLSLAVSGEYAYLLGFYIDSFDPLDHTFHAVLDIVDLSTPTDPARVYHRTFGDDTGYGWEALSVCGATLVISYGFDSQGGLLQLADISDPESPVYLGNCSLPTPARCVEVSGDYAFVACQSAGLYRVSIANTAGPSLCGYYDTPDDAGGVAVSGDYAYVADGTSLEVLKIAQQQYQSEQKVGRSTPVDGSDELISAVRLSSVQTGSVSWEISADGGTNWMSIAPNNVWQVLGVAGPNLIWRSTHNYVSDGINPTCTYLTVDWISQLPIVDVVADVGNDQGHQVRLAWTRSGYDVAGSTKPIIEYAIFRRVEGSESSSDRAAGVGFEPCAPAEDGEPLVAYPPGTWNFIKTVPADREDSYWTVVPTLADSTEEGGAAYTAFFVRARTATPSVYYDSPVDSGYSAVDLTPAPPGGLVVASGASPAQERLGAQGLSGTGNIHDVPGDQGRQVQIVWARDSRDSAGSTTPIAEYSIFRRIDDRSTLLLAGGSEPGAGRLSYPAGSWDFVATVPASCESTYSMVVPTLADSTVADGVAYSVFFARARTAVPGVYFDAPPDSGYSVDNLVPAAPANLRMASATDLAWDESEETDFDYYSVYGSDSPGMDTTSVLIGYTVAAVLDVSGDLYPYYLVTTTDFAGNEGVVASVESGYSGVLPGADLPKVFALKRSRPNPFEGRAVIGFDLPVACDVSIRVYDAEGRQVRALVDRAYPAGRHSAVWAGDADGGRRVGSGIYFMRMEAGDFKASDKVLLVR